MENKKKFGFLNNMTTGAKIGAVVILVFAVISVSSALKVSKTAVQAPAPAPVASPSPVVSPTPAPTAPASQEVKKPAKRAETVVAPQKNPNEFDMDAYIAKNKKEFEEFKNSGTRAGNLCKEHPTWTEGECNQIYWGDVWVGMNREMLRESKGYPDSTRKSNYGDGETTQECFYGKELVCVYYGSDGIVTAYN